MDKNFRIRLGICFLLIAMLGMGVLFRAAYLMLLPSDRLQLAMSRQFRQDPPRTSRRGYILDRNKESMAVSMEVRSLFVNPNKIKNKKQVSRLLSKTINMSYASVSGKIKSNKSFSWVKRHLNEAELSAVEEVLENNPSMALSVGLAKESRRFYPHQTLASQLMGFTGLDTNGLEGLELFYEKEMMGSVDGKKVTDGNTLVLTIDKTLQYTVEEELERGMKETGARSATAIILDSSNGDIIAMSSFPTFNGNRFSVSKPEYRRNKAVTDTYEPGSTIKTILVAGGLENHVVTPKTKVFCEYGKMRIGKHWINEAEAKDKWGWLKVSEVLQKSSNVGSTKIGFLMGPKIVYETYRRFGLGEKTGIDLPGESSGFIPRSDKWSQILHSNIAFGQGLTVTPLQMVRAYAAIANGGYLVTPRLLKQLYSFEGEFLRETPPKPLKRILEAKNAKAVADMLATVTTSDGTAVKAAIPGYIIAGKTGTAQKPIPGKGYRSGKYIASFVGFAKGVKPNYVVLVVVDEPKFPYFGGEAAAPIFRRVMTAALAREGIAPDPSLIVPDSQPAKPLAKMKSVEEKITQVASAPVTLEVDGEEWIMPDLTGLTARDAMNLFNNKGVELNFKGSGRITKQAPKAGSKLQKGDSIALRLSREILMP